MLHLGHVIVIRVPPETGPEGTAAPDGAGDASPDAVEAPMGARWTVGLSGCRGSCTRADGSGTGTSGLAAIFRVCMTHHAAIAMYTTENIASVYVSSAEVVR
jgi:hypothetical protein